MTSKSLVDRAMALGRAGDLLLLGMHGAGGNARELARMAKRARDLLAIPAAAKLWDLVLQAAPDDRTALEQSALALARLGHHDEAERRIERAVDHVRGEAVAIVGRLIKQKWRATWDQPEPVAPGYRTAAALSAGLLNEAIALYTKAYWDEPSHYYAGVNAVTLLEVALSLPRETDATFSQQSARKKLNELRSDLEARIGAAVDLAQTAEEHYWALMSRVELEVTRPSCNPRAARADALEACSLAHGFPFWLDSTLQQMDLLTKLEINVPVVQRVAGIIQDRLALDPNPALRRHRVVFPSMPANGELARAPDWQDREPGLRARFIRTLDDLVAEFGDTIVLLGASAGIDLLFAEACAKCRIPYLLHLPCDAESFVSKHVEPYGQVWVDRFEQIVRMATGAALDDGGLTQKYLVLAEHLGNVVPGAAADVLNEWLLSSACAYGTDDMLVIYPYEEIGDPGLEAFMARVNEIGCPSMVYRLEDSQGPGGGPGISSNADDAITIPRHGAPRRPSASVAAIPAWLYDLASLPEEVHGSPWRVYLESPEQLGLWQDLELRFEPVEILTPRRGVQRQLTGFEVLGGAKGGARYPALLKRADALRIPKLDLDLGLFTLAIRSIRQLRQRLIEIEPRCALLWFTSNITDSMIGSPVLREVMRRYFAPDLASNIQFELSEDFPDGLRDAEGVDCTTILSQALGRLDALMGNCQVKLVLDDSDRLDPRVRASLRPAAGTSVWNGRVVKSKADALYVRRLLSQRHAVKPAGLIAELQLYRIQSLPYVLEGVEIKDDIAFLDHYLPDDLETYIQGWAVRIPERLSTVFVPVHDDPHQPRGYRLARALD